MIRTLARDLNFPIEIVVCPIVREPDGLAMSSRNVYLAPQERKAALVLSKGLFNAKKSFEAGEHDASHLQDVVLETIATEPLAKVQYVSCAHPDTLQDCDYPRGPGADIPGGVLRENAFD